MIKLNEAKLAKLHTSDELFDTKYGPVGSESRNQFDAAAQSYYYGTILRDRRKELKLTQQQLADKIGTARSYIARVEHGAADIQLSTLGRIAAALNMSISFQCY